MSDGASGSRAGHWVLLSYRLPREPSTPRITIWRKLKRLGVAQVADGVVGLPADARTREHVDWIADEISDVGGTATVWLAQPASLQQERQLVQTLADARADEYRSVMTTANQARALPVNQRQRVMRRLRAELRRIQRRDYFPPAERQQARQAVNALHPNHDTDQEEPAS